MIAAGILLAAVAATHFASVEGDEWKSSPLQNMSERSGGSEAANSTLELFATDGKTPRAGSVPWRAWGTTFNELDLDALRMLKPAEQEEILKKLFAPDGELRFTRGRLTMNANDYSREWYSCSEKEGDFELKHFNIEHDKENQIALIRVDSRTKEFSYRPEYLAVRHFSEFVKPGAVQLAYSPWRDSTEALCYRNPDGGIIVVATNWANEERRVSFRIAGKMYVAALRPHSFNTVVLWHAPLSLQGKP